MTVVRANLLPSLRLVALASLGVLVWAGGCSEADWGKEDKPRSMSFSTGQYGVGYRDGMREAMQSWFDDHAGWMWLWAKEPEYRNGYERGWADGRRKVRLQEAQQQSDVQSEQDNLENTPAPEKDSG